MSNISVLRGTTSEIDESIGQFASMWQVFVGDRGNADLADRPGMAVRWADCAFPFWNAIFLTDRRVDADLLGRRLGEAAAHMRRKQAMGFVWLCEDYLDDDAKAVLPAALAQHGLDFALTARGMAGDFLPVPPPSHPDLRFLRVMTDEALQAYADINSRAYGMPLEAGRAGLEGSELWRAGMQTWLGYEDDVPVSAAATVANDGCLFLALVATAPGAQRKGYGEATVRKALYEGGKATGLKRTVLHATDAGFPVYQRIGYRTVATIHAYQLVP